MTMRDYLLKEMIFKRKSCRSFTGKPVDAGIALAHLYVANEERTSGSASSTSAFVI